MNITEILTQAQQSSDAVTDLLIELAQQNKEVTATAQHMCDLYFADVRLREKGIRDIRMDCGISSHINMSALFRMSLLKVTA